MVSPPRLLFRGTAGLLSYTSPKQVNNHGDLCRIFHAFVKRWADTRRARDASCAARITSGKSLRYSWETGRSWTRPWFTVPWPTKTDKPAVTTFDVTLSDLVFVACRRWLTQAEAQTIFPGSRSSDASCVGFWLFRDRTDLPTSHYWHPVVVEAGRSVVMWLKLNDCWNETRSSIRQKRYL